ncbi:DUF397 domain-containing protein [Thermomonospora sp. CIF 1]|uniref:DUF397 domain-containing protein n=1 Tax=Thermomonospora sp. CIF 1 TaxID=1916083 RepID=UPI000CB09077|nr:DUF397 domain-containing protein [Thermomonospora sp. CIF 1]PKK12201.1 MAG: DUF397 domain-containing protein [Thermomonospora sp. CIF 1]
MRISPDLSRVTWRKSSKSTTTGNECVELAAFGDVVAVRDSKNPDGARLVLRSAGFRRLVEDVRRGRHGI